MIWQGEEFLQDSNFDDNYDHSLNWSYQMDGLGLQMQKMYKDAIQLRTHKTAFQYGELIWAHSKDNNGVLAFLRRDNVNSQTMLVVVNFRENNWVTNHDYGISTGGAHGKWRQIFCSQDADYGGWEWSGNAFYEPWTQEDGKVYLNIPKYGVVVMERI